MNRWNRLGNGMSRLSRRRFLWGVGATIPLSQLACSLGKSAYHTYQIQKLASQPRNFAVSDDRPLAARAAEKGIIYGAATQHRLLADDPVFAQAFLQECQMLVTENDLQWDQVHPEAERFDFRAADALAQFAQANRLLLRGHNLVWHNSLPSWFKTTATVATAREILIHHIQTVVGRYTGQMQSWDVVNEAILPSDGRADGLRKTPWLELIGPDYIELAFQTAVAADPTALLVYNDFELDYDRPQDEAKRIAVLRLLEQLKHRNVPIHALGMQAHLWGGETRFSAAKLSRFLESVASLGLKILVTELDVTDKLLPQDEAIRDRIVAGAYADYLAVLLDQPAVIAILTWGLSDRYTWLSEFEPRPDGTPVRPLPFDQNLERKLAWNAIARAFDQAPARTGSAAVSGAKTLP